MHYDKDQSLRVLDMIHEDNRSVQLQKLSSTTLIYDCIGLEDWLKTMGAKIADYRGSLGSRNLSVWRCRIGRNRWCFGYTASDAVICAYDNMHFVEHEATKNREAS